jgi:hypothetical protein
MFFTRLAQMETAHFRSRTDPSRSSTRPIDPIASSRVLVACRQTWQPTRAPQQLARHRYGRNSRTRRARSREQKPSFRLISLFAAACRRDVSRRDTKEHHDNNYPMTYQRNLCPLAPMPPLSLQDYGRAHYHLGKFPACESDALHRRAKPMAGNRSQLDFTRRRMLTAKSGSGIAWCARAAGTRRRPRAR